MREALVEAVLRAMYDKAKPEPAAWPFQSSKYGRRTSFANHKLEAPEKKR
jgi:hypothetical protein